MNIKKFLSSRSSESIEAVSFLLIEGKPASKEIVFVIRKVPRKEFGGAWVGVGPTLSIPWSSILERGIAAFDAVRSVSPESAGNSDLAPGKGKFRNHRVVLVEVSFNEVLLSPWKRKSSHPIEDREQDRRRLRLPVSGEALEQALREMFSRL